MSTYKYIDLSYLDLMADGDLEMKQMMLGMMLEEIPSEIQKMEMALGQKNWKELKEVSHKMKSTLSFVGNETMTETNKTIEEIAKTEDGLEQLPDLLAILLKIYPNVISELKVVEESL